MTVFQEGFIFIKYIRRGRQYFCGSETGSNFLIYFVFHQLEIARNKFMS